MDFQGVNDPLRIDTSNQGGWAKLYLYAPQLYGTQVLRPFVYGFTEDVAGVLLSKGDTLSDSIRRKDVMNTENIANIIKPDPVGTAIDMSTFSAMWSFVLILHIPNNMNSGILAADGSKLLIFRGHCGDEPIDPNSAWMSSPIVNPNCRLLVHSREILRDNPKSISAFGMRNTIDVCGNTDVIDGCLNVCSNNRELYTLTPSEVLENYSFRGVDVASAPGLCSITNDRKPIAADLKDPGLHLRQILQGIDASNEEAISSEFAPHGIDSFSGVLSPATDVMQFKESVVSQLSMMSGPSNVEQGIEIRNVVTIGDIERAYPNLVVIPSQVEGTSMMDIIPQDMVNKRTAYSSMAASAISSIAAGCGLGSIAFMFQSYDPARGGDLDKTSHQVVPEYTTLSCPPSNPEMYNSTLVAAVQLFIMKIKSDLMPFIKYICGDFCIKAYYAMDRETMVDLQFLDDSASTNGDGWFQTPSRLSSLSTTSVGTKENFESNGHSLNSFVMQIQGKTQKGALGLEAFNRPGIDFGAPADNALNGLFSTSMV